MRDLNTELYDCVEVPHKMFVIMQTEKVQDIK